MPPRIAFAELITPALFQFCLGKRKHSLLIILCCGFILSSQTDIWLSQNHISSGSSPESRRYCFASNSCYNQQPQFPQSGAQKVHIKGYIKGDNTKSSSLSPESLRYYLHSTSCTINKLLFPIKGFNTTNPFFTDAMRTPLVLLVRFYTR